MGAQQRRCGDVVSGECARRDGMREIAASSRLAENLTLTSQMEVDLAALAAKLAALPDEMNDVVCCFDGKRTLRDFFFSSRRRHTRSTRDWSSDVSLPICRSFFMNGGSWKSTGPRLAPSAARFL